LPTEKPSGFVLEIDVGERLPVGVADDEQLLDGPWRRGAAGIVRSLTRRSAYHPRACRPNPPGAPNGLLRGAGLGSVRVVTLGREKGSELVRFDTRIDVGPFLGRRGAFYERSSLAKLAAIRSDSSRVGRAWQRRRQAGPTATAGVARGHPTAVRVPATSGECLGLSAFQPGSAGYARHAG
jgi:hypothetical protein